MSGQPHQPRTSGEQSQRSSPPVCLADVTLERLLQFSDRQRQLKLWRGVSLTLWVCWCVLLSAVIVDAWWLQAWAPWVGSAALYGVTLSLAGWQSARYLRQRVVTRQSLTQAARQFEQLDPRLREKLLAAVELSDLSPSHGDSPDFRRRLQRQVARLIEAVDLTQLLPWALVQRRVVWATAAWIVLVLLCCIPQWHLPRRLARIIAPWGAWGRVSQVAITLELPHQPDRIVPRDDLLAVRARVDGPRPHELWLETRTAATAAEGTRQYPMALINDSVDSPKTNLFRLEQSRFEWLLPVTVPAMEYRVHGSGASTAWYSLKSLPRPSPTELVISCAPPLERNTVTTGEPSASWPVTTISLKSTLGHSPPPVQVLQGSLVQLHVRVDQPLSRCELRWDSADRLDLKRGQTLSGEAPPKGQTPFQTPPKGQTPFQTPPKGQTPFQMPPKGQTPFQTLVRGAEALSWQVEFPLSESVAFKLHLQSAATGFTNSFSPSYRLEAVPDRPPVVTWIEPELPRMLRAPYERVRLRCRVTDELPNVAAMGWVSTNGGDWQSRSVVLQAPLDSSETLEHSQQVEWELDLSELQVKPGDQVHVKLSASDAGGQTSHSSVLEVELSSVSLQLTADRGEALRREVEAGLQRVTEQLARLGSLFDVTETPNTHNGSQPQGMPAGLEPLQWTEELHRELLDTQRAVARAVLQADSAVSSQSLLEVAQALRPLMIANARRRELWQAESASNSPAGPFIESAQAAWRSDLQLAQELAQTYAVLTTQDTLVRQLAQIASLAAAQRSLVANPSGAEVPAQMQRRRVVLAEHLQQLYQAMFAELAAVREATRPALQSVAMQVGQLADTLLGYDPLTNPQSPEALLQTAGVQLDQLRVPQRWDPRLPEAVQLAHQRLAALAHSAPSTQGLSRWWSAPGTEANRSEVLEGLSQRRELERAAPQGDRLYAADLGQARRALAGLPAADSGATSSANLVAFDGAWLVLEAVHQLEEVQTLLAELLTTERQSDGAAQQAARGHQTWQLMLQRLEQAIEGLRLVPQASAPALSELEQLASSDFVRQTSQRWEGRWRQSEPAASLASDLQRLRLELQQVQSDLEPLAQQARQTLAALAPRPSELAAAAARVTRELEGQVHGLADGLDHGQVPDVESRLAILAQQAQQLDLPLEELREALVDMADQQDLLQSQQAQVAQGIDAAIEVVDRAHQGITQARAAVPPEQFMNLSSQQLRESAAGHADSAAALEQLTAELQRWEAESATDTEAQLVQQSPSPAVENEQVQQAYQQAQQLAELAHHHPAEVLKKLESELGEDPPMARQLSRITRQILEHVLQSLAQTATDQHGLTMELEQADPVLNAQKELLVHDLRLVGQGVQHSLDTLFKEARWTAQAARYPAFAESLDRDEPGLRAVTRELLELSSNAPFQLLLDKAAAAQRRMADVARELHTHQQALRQACSEEAHSSGAELANRRREMGERQRRVQAELARQAQELALVEQQRLQQWQAAVTEASAQRPAIADEARAQLLAAVEQRANGTKDRARQLASQPLVSLDAVNPTAQLALEFSRQAAEAMTVWEERLQSWQAAPQRTLQSRAAALEPRERQQAQIAVRLEEAVVSLQRAARHEARLQNSDASHELASIGKQTAQLVQVESQQVLNSLKAAQRQAAENSQRASIKPRETFVETTAVHSASQLAVQAIEDISALVRHLLQESRASSEASVSSKPTEENSQPANNQALSALSSAQKARLMDELDQRLYAELELGAKEDDGSAQASTPDGSSANSMPQSLTDAASQLAKGLSQSRQPVTSEATTDLATATAAGAANARPAAAAAVRLYEFDRVGGGWGELREQTSEGLLESGRVRLTPRFRKQTEAYFRELAERGRDR